MASSTRGPVVREETTSSYGQTGYSNAFDDDDDWGTDDLSRMADTIAEGAVRLAAKAKSLFDNF